ncbi:MAG: response regulator, partial [Clostridiales bacterium]|nr:response regulator [Clostridiales bacterium]
MLEDINPYPVKDRELRGRDTILIVDDIEVNRIILQSIFEKDYNLLEAENGDQAMVLLKQYHRNIAAVLLDLVMPQKDGYQVLAEMNDMHLLPECPVIIITSEDSPDNTVKAFDLGASDIVMKPFDPVIVKHRVENSIALSRNQQNLQERIDEQAARLMESNAVMIDALSAIIEYRSVETGQHIQRIRMFTRILLEEISGNFPELGLDRRQID